MAINLTCLQESGDSKKIGEAYWHIENPCESYNVGKGKKITDGKISLEQFDYGIFVLSAPKNRITAKGILLITYYDTFLLA